MQATVRGFDAATRSGSVFTDEGTVCAFGAEEFGASGLRLLRPGQRVAIRLRGDGTVCAITLATFPLPEPPAPATEPRAAIPERPAPGRAPVLPGHETAPPAGTTDGAAPGG
jgi:hypothetical protein